MNLHYPETTYARVVYRVRVFSKPGEFRTFKYVVYDGLEPSQGMFFEANGWMFYLPLATVPDCREDEIIVTLEDLVPIPGRSVQDFEKDTRWQEVKCHRMNIYYMPASFVAAENVEEAVVGEVSVRRQERVVSAIDAFTR